MLLSRMQRYEIFELIGEGSFGKVYRGKDKERKQNVAVKYIPKAGRTVKDISSLRQECEILQKLKHPHIIQLLDSVETQDHIVLVTEFAKGDIYSLLRESGTLKIPKVQLIASQLVSALYYLHSLRILHRDLKPQNILISSDGFTKVCDFGFARTISLGTYMLTSVKGTPLYMAPEIMNSKPYDHNCDLWSLGCILYELIVGHTPFPSETIVELVNTILHDEIRWPSKIAVNEHCKSFLEGLLQKNPAQRLTWPDLKMHPFVEPFFLTEAPEEKFSLTKALSPSQELAKERERALLQKKLDGYSKLLVKTAKKLKEAQKELKRCSAEARLSPVKTPLASAGSGDARGRKTGATRDPSDSDTNSASSYETSTSSSLSDTSEDCQTVILDRPTSSPRIFSPTSEPAFNPQQSHGSSTCSYKRKPVSPLDTIQSGVENMHITNSDKSRAKRASEGPSKSGALFTVHSMRSEDKPIESEEWIDFVGKTMKEVQENPESLCEKHFLTVLVAPLRNHLAEAIVIGKIATLLSMPFTLSVKKDDLQKNLEAIYYDTKVLPNLLYACKLIVRRRKIVKSSSSNVKSGEEYDDVDAIVSILEEEDLDGLDKNVRLITYLVHLQKDFAVQLCDSILVLKVSPVFSLFLRLHALRTRITIDTLAVLCHILRVLPQNGNIVEELVLDCGSLEADEPLIFTLLSHADPGIQSKALRLLGYLITHSETVRKDLCRPKSDQLWSIITQASSHPNDSISAAAEFTSAKLQEFIPLPAKSRSEEVETLGVSQ